MVQALHPESSKDAWTIEKLRFLAISTTCISGTLAQAQLVNDFGSRYNLDPGFRQILHSKNCRQIVSADDSFINLRYNLDPGLSETMD